MDFANWKRSEQASVGITLLFALASGFFAFIPTTVFIQAIAAGALGGLFHEIAQSGGKIFFMQKREDGLYLGSLTGMVLGSVAGLILLQGFLPPARLCETNTNGTPEAGCVEFNRKAGNVANVRLILEIFLAGMALKGVAEAATGQEVPLNETPTTTEPLVENKTTIPSGTPLDDRQAILPEELLDNSQVVPEELGMASRTLRPRIDPNIP
jgi:hypothetical protein